MLARKSLSKKRIIILGGTMGVVWLIIGWVVYQNFVPKSSAPPPVSVLAPINNGVTTPIVEPGQTTVTSVEVLRDPKLVNLKVYGEVPLEVKVLGRDDPFAVINP